MSESGQVQWLFCKEPATREQVESVGRRLGVRLPDDYASLVQRVNGGQPDHDAFDIEGRFEAVLNRLLPIGEQHPGNMELTAARLAERLPRGIVPFADDPFGNFICFDYRYGNRPVVVFWDHERAETEPDRAVSFICASFTELIGKLREQGY